MTESIHFNSATGESVAGALALPAGDGPAPAIVLLHEWWGLNGHIRSLLDRFAAEGFIALAPDLYKGFVAKDDKEAHSRMMELKWATALDEVRGAVSFIKAHPRSNGKVGATGFCMGGAGTLAAACKVRGLSAAAPFYGVPPAQYMDWEHDDVPPIQCHFSQRDDWAKPSIAEGFGATLAKRAKAFELFTYDADHAFMNDTRPEVYDAEAAALAWGRVVTFFHKHLG